MRRASASPRSSAGSQYDTRVRSWERFDAFEFIKKTFTSRAAGLGLNIMAGALITLVAANFFFFY